MKRFKQVLFCLAAVMSVPMLFAADPTISLTATPRYPWNGLVDLAFTIDADDADGGYADPEPGDELIEGHRLKYVRSAGDAQLNTGVVPGSKNTIELKFAWEDNLAKVNECLFCARGSTTSTATFTGFLINGRCRFDYNTTTGSTNGVPLASKGVPIVVRDVAGTASVDGIVRQSFSATSFTVGGPLTLFASYVGAPGTSTDNHLAGKIYYFKIFGDDGVTLLHNFVPWEKNGVVGMYDMIAKRFVAPNVGTLTCGAKYDTSFSAQDVVGGTNLAMRTVYKSPGVKANTGLEKLVPGTYNWLWDAPADVGNDFVSENVVIDAKVGDAITYSVKFNANGGTGSMANETFESGVAKALTANAFKRTGYLFQGWATSADGAKVYSDKQVVTDLTSTAGGTVNLYALWKNNSYSVKFNANGGSGTMANEAMELGVAKALTANAFTRTGFAFQGWATSASGAVKYTNKQSVNNLTSTVGATVNLYAVWKASGGVQLWANGPYWAECNVGATKPEQNGYYFWWGGTIGYKRNSAGDGWASVKNGATFYFQKEYCPTYGKSDSQLRSSGYIGSTGNLVAAHDAATVYLGAPWRMPTSAEINALVNNCTTTWTTRNGVKGRLVSGKGSYASKSIFIPAAGYGDSSYLFSLGSNGHYWSSTSYSDDNERYELASELYFYSSRFTNMPGGASRDYGLPVRPIRNAN